MCYLLELLASIELVRYVLERVDRDLARVHDKIREALILFMKRSESDRVAISASKLSGIVACRCRQAVSICPDTGITLVYNFTSTRFT